MNLEALAVLSLAAWRLATLLVHEDGPWKLAYRLREAAGITHDEDGDVLGVPESMPGAIFGCVWCMGVWTAAFMMGAWLFLPGLVWLFAVAGAAALIDVTMRRLRDGNGS